MRYLVLLLTAGITATASGQTSAPRLTASEQLRLLDRNRALLEHLVDRGLGLTSANSPLGRLEECRLTTDRLADELKYAVAGEDADRIAEIGDHLVLIVRDGVVPNLTDARDHIPPDSADFPKLVQAHQLTRQSIEPLAQLLPTNGKLGKSQRVQATKIKLELTATGLPQLTPR
jgi:hypothetical protein